MQWKVRVFIFSWLNLVVFYFLNPSKLLGNKDSDGSFHIMLGFHQVGFELVQTTEVTKTGQDMRS